MARVHVTFDKNQSHGGPFQIRVIKAIQGKKEGGSWVGERGSGRREKSPFAEKLNKEDNVYEIRE